MSFDPLKPGINAIDSTKWIIEKVKSIDRILLILSISSIIISCILTLVFSEKLNLNNEWLSTFIWISIVVGVWICILSTIALAVSMIIFKLKNMGTWRSFKQEILLTCAAILSLTFLWLCGLVVY